MQQYIKQPAQLTKAVPASGGDGRIRTHVPAHHRQNDFESFSLRPLRYISVFISEYNNSTKKGGGQVKIAAKRPSYKESIDTYMLT